MNSSKDAKDEKKVSDPNKKATKDKNSSDQKKDSSIDPKKGHPTAPAHNKK